MENTTLKSMLDKYQREINYLRLSLNESCNFKCSYCVDEKITSTNQLSLDQVEAYVDSAIKQGINKIRLTGGEPLIHPQFMEIVNSLNKYEAIKSLHLTTNAYLLDKYLAELVDTKLETLNISIDSLKRERFYDISKVDGLNRVFNNIIMALDYGFKVKVNVVLMQGINDDEFIDFIMLTKLLPIDLRFIELMPLGAAKSYQGLSSDELLLRLVDYDYHYIGNKGVASEYQLVGAKGSFGFISPISHNFCASCNRIRITADGKLKPCLHSRKSLVLDGDLDEVFTQAITQKPSAHSFESESDELEDKYMYQIGG